MQNPETIILDPSQYRIYHPGKKEGTESTNVINGNAIKISVYLSPSSSALRDIIFENISGGQFEINYNGRSTKVESITVVNPGNADKFTFTYDTKGNSLYSPLEEQNWRTMLTTRLDKPIFQYQEIATPNGFIGPSNIYSTIKSHKGVSPIDLSILSTLVANLTDISTKLPSYFLEQARIVRRNPILKEILENLYSTNFVVETKSQDVPLRFQLIRRLLVEWTGWNLETTYRRNITEKNFNPQYDMMRKSLQKFIDEIINQKDFLIRDYEI